MEKKNNVLFVFILGQKDDKNDIWIISWLFFFSVYIRIRQMDMEHGFYLIFFFRFVWLSIFMNKNCGNGLFGCCILILFSYSAL